MLKLRIGPDSSVPNATPPRAGTDASVGEEPGSALMVEPETGVSLPSLSTVKVVSLGATDLRSRTPSPALFATTSVLPESPRLDGALPFEEKGEPSTA